MESVSLYLKKKILMAYRILNYIIIRHIPAIRPSVGKGLFRILYAD